MKWMWVAVVGSVAVGLVLFAVLGGRSTGPRPATVATRAQPTFRGTPDGFLTRVVELLVANRYAQAWQTLNPIDKTAVARKVYVACESAAPVRGRLVSIRVLHVRPQRIRVAPEQQPTTSTEVTFALRMASPDSVTGVKVVAHAVEAHGRWTWILPPARLRMYRQHRC
jgi:hypothetical protein